jgi:putative ABC transport system ATP-binding protein
MEGTTQRAATPELEGGSAEPLTRILELLAEVNGQQLEPRVAWEAAAEGIVGGRGDMLRSLRLAVRRVGLRLGPCRLAWPCEAKALAELDGPAATWIPGPAGGRWLVVLARRGRRLQLAVVDRSGERRHDATARQLARWLDARWREGRGGGQTEDEAAAAALPWVEVEPLLPLARLESAGAGERMSPVRRLLALAQLERADLAVVVVYALALGSLSLAVPVAVQALVNTVAYGSVLQPVVVLSLLLAAVLGFVGVLRVLEVVVVEALQRRLFVRTAADFARRLPRLSSAARHRAWGPELANRFFDVVGLQKAGAKLLLDGLALVLQMAVGMVLLAFYHPLLLAFDLALLAGLVVVVVVFGRGAVATSLAESKRKYAVAAWLEDVAGSPLRFAGASARAFADARAELLAREWLQARSQHFRRVLHQLCGGLGLQVVAATALLGIGGALVIQRQLTLGQLVAAELVVTAIGDGLGKLGRQLESWYDAVASAEKIGKVVDMPLERGGGELLEGSGPLALRVRGGLDIDIDLAPGAKLGLRGVCPAHSRLLDRVAGLEGAPAEGGELRLDGRPVEVVDLESLRSALALVRGVEIVGGSLLDNLDPPFLPVAGAGATRPGPEFGAAVREVLDLVGLGERVRELPEGMGTHLQPSGAPLYPSEARRLVLARALLRRPRLLLIDGGLDGLGLDDPTRERLLDRIFAPDAPWTALVVSDDRRVLVRCSEQLA